MATGAARMPDAASLPRRNERPRDVDVPALAGAGITWYDPGGRYGARRVALTAVWAVVLLPIVLRAHGYGTAGG
jgi:hypothetical protein